MPQIHCVSSSRIQSLKNPLLYIYQEIKQGFFICFIKWDDLHLGVSNKYLHFLSSKLLYSSVLVAQVISVCLATVEHLEIYGNKFCYLIGGGAATVLLRARMMLSIILWMKQSLIIKNHLLCYCYWPKCASAETENHCSSFQHWVGLTCVTSRILWKQWCVT